MDTCGQANSIWIRIRVDVEIFESRKKNLRIKNYQDTCGRGLERRGEDRIAFSIKFDNVAPATMAWGIFFKMCAARSGFFLFISQYCCMLFFIFSFPSPSSWLFQLASSVTTQNNSWYAMISLKSWRFDGKLKGRRKRRPRLLASREARIWKQLNLLPWMLAITLTKLTTVHLPSRILLVSLSSAFRFTTFFAYMQPL